MDHMSRRHWQFCHSLSLCDNAIKCSERGFLFVSGSLYLHRLTLWKPKVFVPFMVSKIWTWRLWCTWPLNSWKETSFGSATCLKWPFRWQVARGLSPSKVTVGCQLWGWSRQHVNKRCCSYVYDVLWCHVMLRKLVVEIACLFFTVSCVRRVWSAENWPLKYESWCILAYACPYCMCNN